MIPYQSRVRTQKSYIRGFRGLDRREQMTEGAFFDMKNMSGHRAPMIASRKERGEVPYSGAKVREIMSLDVHIGDRIENGALVALCDDRLRAFYKENGEIKTVNLFNTSTLSEGEKTFVVSGTKVYFFPDNISYDLMDRSVEKLDTSVSFPLGALDDGYYEAVLESCDMDGADADEASPYRRLKINIYSLISGGKGEYRSSAAFSSSISAGDTVEISGLEGVEAISCFNIVSIPAGRESLVIASDMAFTQSTGTLTVSRSVPQMDYVVAAGNRLWGCRYGLDAYGNCVNEIYASALGDAKNWNKLEGVSTDSWKVSVGAPGAYTGAVCIDGSPVFFKEDAVIKIYGDYPQQFTLSESVQRGIEMGSAKSAAFVNDVLYYKTADGIVRYDGGVPVNVDRALGDEVYKNAVAGSCGNKYYVSMENEAGERILFVYDTVSGTWHKEDSISIKGFCRCRGDLYFLADTDGETRILSVSASEGLIPEGDFEWMCESSPEGYDTPDRKYVRSIQIRLDCTDEGECDVFIEYDSNGKWRMIESIRGEKSPQTVRIRPHRCDSFKIRLSGRGECAVRSVTKTLAPVSGYGRIRN